jgi:glycosyltransferase involved in cell wall biosynthesis
VQRFQEEKIPKVSVCVITYNQEKYIRQCLQSIMDQETDFNLEVIVGDDCSTDGTRTIVQEFAERYKGIVKTIFQEKNTGGTKNYLDVHGAARGEYIAHIDGDDFMLPGKLRMQAEELDKNPDCAICVHATRHFDQHNQRYLKLWPMAIPRKSDITFLLMNLTFFDHSSKMYRAACRNGFELLTKQVIDCQLHVHNALSGKILYLNEVLGVYRLNVGASTVGNDNRSVYKIPAPWMIGLIIEAIEYAGRSGVEADFINKAKSKAYFDFSRRHLLAKDFINFQLLINKSTETAIQSRSGKTGQ